VSLRRATYSSPRRDRGEPRRRQQLADRHRHIIGPADENAPVPGDGRSRPLPVLRASNLRHQHCFFCVSHHFLSISPPQPGALWVCEPLGGGRPSGGADSEQFGDEAHFACDAREGDALTLADVQEGPVHPVDRDRGRRDRGVLRQSAVQRLYLRTEPRVGDVAPS
jgi:hypothetical protein